MARVVTPPPARSVPDAGRAAPAVIVHLYEPAGEPAESQVQSAAAPFPVPCATRAPAFVVTATVHGVACESRARTRTSEPVASAFGSKILSPPIARADVAIALRRAYSASPGHSVAPVSRWPETALSTTDAPLT